MKKYLLLVVFLFLIFPQSGSANTCPINLQLIYPDGEKGCLSDLPISKSISKAWGKSVLDVITYSRQYAIAASDICSDVSISTNVWKDKREAEAISSCPSDCDCTVIIGNGRVRIAKNLMMALGSSKLGAGSKDQAVVEVEDLRKQEIKEEARLVELAKNREREQNALAQKLQEQQRIANEQAQIAQAEQKRRQEESERLSKENERKRLAEEQSLKEQVAAQQALAEKIKTEKLAEEAKAREQQRLAAEALLKEQEQLALAAKLREQQKIAEELTIKEQIRLAQIAKQKEQQELERQAREREQKRLAEEALLREQEALRLVQAQKIKEAKLAEEARLKEQQRLAELAKAKEQDQLAVAAKLKEQQKAAELQAARAREEQTRLAQEQERKSQEAKQTTSEPSDRELLLQLAAELAKLRAEAAARNSTISSVSPEVQTKPPSAEPLPIFANRKALVIGNDNYKFVSKLANAKEDAKVMADSLKNVGYNVTLKTDVSEKEMKSVLRAFKSQVEAGDEVAFFYAGHGVQLANSNYLVPIDVAGEGEEQMRDEGVSLQRILDDMSEKRAKFTLAVVDACRDNPFQSNGRAIGGNGRGMAPTTAATGQMIVFSAGTGQQALDKLGPNDKEKNGLFTRIFVREMQRPGISIDRVVRNVRGEVVNLAKSVGHDQVPAIYDQVVGEFYFRNK